ncbi:PREDICTED: uncharacterized protein LOC109326527 [Lupinus angustifolius]|uniref:uncharacterized protein LOC109326527 n=1 Tax=Lupinus angustifolius TaxID=3871 RepID=UPI00092EA7AE|nr:PREDICTED: uncharacterized protein LOC109326527 [Lupinus angustifolius]
MSNHQVQKKGMMEKPSTPLPPPPSHQLESQLSIEEPKTLHHGELDLAREAAIKIMNSHSKEEALEIFTEGLVPIKISKEAKVDIAVSEWDEEY